MDLKGIAMVAGIIFIIYYSVVVYLAVKDGKKEEKEKAAFDRKVQNMKESEFFRSIVNEMGRRNRESCRKCVEEEIARQKRQYGRTFVPEPSMRWLEFNSFSVRGDGIGNIYYASYGYKELTSEQQHILAAALTQYGYKRYGDDVDLLLEAKESYWMPTIRKIRDEVCQKHGVTGTNRPLNI